MKEVFLELLLVFMPASADTDIVMKTFKCTQNPCVVKKNPGGNVREFMRAAEEMKNRGWTLVIDGDCFSACTITADMMRSNVCITPHAAFHFHQTYKDEEREVAGKVEKIKTPLGDPPQSNDLAAWNYRRGGYPVIGFNRMDYREALMFWRPCNFPHTGRGFY